ncbi:MAG: FecR family protein [Acidobacteria bacterium]|nr:FecR family protein [Acidobacteriota bacterium]
MKLKQALFLLLVAGLILPAGQLAAAGNAIYGHISFVDNGATILRVDGGEDQAVVNLPLAPGDTVITSDGGRCELQFDNGTVVRLDKGSRLRLASVLAPSLTSSWKITTLELEKGQLYALPQSYSREMFQVITPNAAANLKTRVRAYVRMDDDGGTSFFSDGGKFNVLYGADSRSLRRIKIKSNRPAAITAAHAASGQVEKRGLEFMAWNEYVDRHFMELHRGMSKIPPKLKLGNPALTYWAEKWSSLYGEWIYDDLLGYVWRPADEVFAYSHRPFFHASFTRIAGQLFLVPQEPWSWVPAHMGTWIWLDRGWTWIPGDWFHPGIVDYQGIHTFPTFYYYWNLYYWNMYTGYRDPRLAGEPGWPNRFPKKTRPPRLPGPAIKIVRKVVKTPEAEKRRIVDRVVPAIDDRKLPSVPATLVPAPSAPPAPVHGTPAGAERTPRRQAQPVPTQMIEKGPLHDWNPDRRWATRNGYSIRYASSRNAVECPELKIFSDTLPGVGRMALRQSTEGGKQGGAPANSVTGQPAGGTGAKTGAAAPEPKAGNSKEKDDGKGR